MEEKKIMTAEILRQELLAKGVMKLVLCAPEAARAARAGQFVNVYTEDSALLLPRPISICDAEGDRLMLVYGIVGRGTQWFSKRCADEHLRISTPLGNGYDLSDIKPGDSALLFGGGIGVPPMVKLAKTLTAMGVSVRAAAGFRDESFLLEELSAAGAQTLCATDSGREGYRGTALSAAEDVGWSGDHWFACGPKPMLAAVAKAALACGKDAQVSMEERMGCGYGACVGCTVDVKPQDAMQPVRKKVCKDGPVFLGSEVFFDER